MNKSSFLFPFIVLSALLIALESPAIGLSLSSAMFVHEFGHIIAIKLLGGTIQNCNLYGAGANISFNLPDCPKSFEIIVYSSGPLLGVLFSYLGYLMGLKLFAEFSLSLSVVNLVPALPLDGGNILRTVLPCKTSNIITTIVSSAFGLFSFIFGIVIVFKNGNFSLLIIGICIISTIISKTALQ